MSDRTSPLASGLHGERASSILSRLMLPALLLLAAIGWSLLAYRAFPTSDRLLLDFTQYYDAGRALLTNTSPYRPEARQYSPAPFLLPPIFAMAVMPLAALPVAWANGIWFVLSLAFLALGCAGVVLLASDPHPTLRSSGADVTLMLVLAVLLLPVWTGAKLGQITALLFALTMGGLAARRAGHAALGGAMLGVAIAFKFVPAVIAVFGFWVGWRRFALMAGAVFLALQGVSALAYPAIFTEYWSSTIFTIPAISHAVNLSLIGTASRFGAPLTPLAVPAALVLSGVMVLLPFAAAWRWRDEQTVLLALALLVAATVTAAPLVEHHYMIWLLMPIWVLLSGFIRRRSVVGLVALAAIFGLLSQPYRIARAALAVVPARWDSELLGEVILTGGALLLYGLALAVLGRRNRVAYASGEAAQQELAPRAPAAQ